MSITTDGTNGIATKISDTVNGAVRGAKEAAMATIPLLINNKPHNTRNTFAVHSPATDELLHHCGSASVADAEAAVKSAHAAFPSWRRLSPSKKRDIFLKAANLMTERTAELKKHMMNETGAEAGWADFNIGLAPEILRDVAGRIASITGTIPVPADENTSALVFKEPYGVILAIAPWNAPYILGVRSVAYALAAGNTAVLKAPEFSPACSYSIVTALHDAGLPEGVLNMLAHAPKDAAEITKYLIAHPQVKKINFTGSTMVGKIIAETAGKYLKPVLLELGGKAPAIVWEDADLELAAMECAKGSFIHSGQICMSTERVLVHEKVAKEFEEQFRAAIKKFAPSEKEAGCLINKGGVEKNKKLVKDAVDKGAILLHGSGEGEDGVGAKMRPAVIKGVTKDMDIYSTESFGPTLSLMEFKNEEEALQLANDTEFGLSAAVFTKDLGRGLRFAKEIESGAVHINHMSIHDETALPHGGMKASGYGRFGAVGLDEWVRTKTVTFQN